MLSPGSLVGPKWLDDQSIYGISHGGQVTVRLQGPLLVIAVVECEQSIAGYTLFVIDIHGCFGWLAENWLNVY